MLLLTLETPLVQSSHISQAQVSVLVKQVRVDGALFLHHSCPDCVGIGAFKYIYRLQMEDHSDNLSS